jgi:phosphopantothenoylcysteine synthetase/decarboxylase
MNPIYKIAKDNGIETVKTWDDEENSKDRYYWYKGTKEELDEDKVDKMSEAISDFIDSKKKKADV